MQGVTHAAAPHSDMHQLGTRWRLDPMDHIRANRLIQGGFDVDGFARWYKELSPGQIAPLIVELHYFAAQAGIDEAVFAQAIDGWRSCASESVERSLRVQSLERLGYDGRLLREEVESAPPDLQRSYFWLAVHLFAIAERKNQTCGATSECNHWWHKDLHDDQVVQAILTTEFGQRPRASGVKRKPLSGLLRALGSRLKAKRGA